MIIIEQNWNGDAVFVHCSPVVQLGESVSESAFQMAGSQTVLLYSIYLPEVAVCGRRGRLPGTVELSSSGSVVLHE